MRTTPPAHYVSHNKITSVPRNFIYLDSEALRTDAPHGEIQTFRLAVASYDRRRHDKNGWADRETEAFYDTSSLWAWIDARTQTRARTVVVAHNLAYDVRITNALAHLPELGWSLKRIAFGHGRMWASWSRGDRTIALVDSMAWVPIALERLGEMVGIAKLPLPAWADSNADWELRCRRDVEILGAVWRLLMDWIRANDLGNWKPTGAGQSWAAFRHRFMTDRLLAHDNDDARTAERRAAWTGRCEVWRHGRPRGGPFSEWDYSAAYAHVGLDCEVPIRLIGESNTATLDNVLRKAKKHAVLAECTITTDAPTVPADINGRIAWPVGTFRTTLWENEIALAIEHGAEVAVHRVWWYKRSLALHDFNRFVLAHLDPRVTNLEPVVVCAAKHWSRALVGRFGARWSEWEDIGDNPGFDLGITTVIDGGDGARWQMLTVGDACKRETALTDSADSVVSIMSWIMAECRVRLWRLCELAGAENVVYMDTDGVIVNAAGTERLRAADVAGLKLKGEWATIELMGPRQIKLSGQLRAAGVPRGAVEVSPNTYDAQVWTELGTSLRTGTADQVGVFSRRVKVTGVDARRDHLPGGRTAPRRLSVQVST